MVEVDVHEFTKAAQEIGLFYESSSGESIPEGWTTSEEMAKVWNVGVDTAYKRLKRMAANGAVEEKKVAHNLIIWRLANSEEDESSSQS